MSLKLFLMWQLTGNNPRPVVEEERLEEELQEEGGPLEEEERLEGAGEEDFDLDKVAHNIHVAHQFYIDYQDFQYHFLYP